MKLTTREMLDELVSKTGGYVTTCCSCHLDYIVHSIHTNEELCIACAHARTSMDRKRYGIMHPTGRKRGRPIGSKTKVLATARL